MIGQSRDGQVEMAQHGLHCNLACAAAAHGARVDAVKAITGKLGSGVLLTNALRPRRPQAELLDPGSCIELALVGTSISGGPPPSSRFRRSTASRLPVQVTPRLMAALVSSAVGIRG